MWCAAGSRMPWAARRSPASRSIPSSTMAYRWNTLRVRCPVSFIATVSGIPARIRSAPRSGESRAPAWSPSSRRAECRPSGAVGARRRPAPAPREDAARGDAGRRPGLPEALPCAPSSRQNTQGTTWPVARWMASTRSPLRLQHRPQLRNQRELPTLPVLGFLWFQPQPARSAWRRSRYPSTARIAFCFAVSSCCCVRSQSGMLMCCARLLIRRACRRMVVTRARSGLP